MSLTVASRFCGNVYIIDCEGHITSGHATTILEEALDQAEQEFSCFVLNLSKVTRMDSMGLGLLVRHASRLGKRRGSIRLANPQPFVAHLLGITKLTDFLRSYPTEAEAVESFLGPCPPPSREAKSGPTLMVFDQSPDLCIFVRTVLEQHGFKVRTVCSLRDAKVLLCADKVDYILIGPCTPQLTSQMVAKELSSLAPKAAALQLSPDFISHNTTQATQTLLQMLGVGGAS
ncbi:MAG: anti-sigma factor antagonist [Acidobacteriaceae bacterium]